MPGFCVYLEPSRERDLIAALVEAGAREVSRDAIEAARIEAGYPIFGVDMTDDTIPLEAGIEDRAISMSKGCYVGQEVIIRVLHRGHGRVARKLVTLRIDPASSRSVGRGCSRRIAMWVLSRAQRRHRDSVRSRLGYVHRDFVAPGTTIEAAADSGRVPATVTERVILSGA